jgi:hypothetical protein
LTTEPPSIEDTSKPSAASTYPPTTSSNQTLEHKPEPKVPVSTGLRSLGGLGLGLPGSNNAAPSRPQIMPLGNLGFGDAAK